MNIDIGFGIHIIPNLLLFTLIAKKISCYQDPDEIGRTFQSPFSRIYITEVQNEIVLSDHLFYRNAKTVLIVLFVCLEFYVPLENLLVSLLIYV